MVTHTNYTTNYQPMQTHPSSHHPSAQMPVNIKHLLEKEKYRHVQEMAKTIREVQQKARRDIGHELHDNVNQLLAVVKLSIEALELQNEDNRLNRNRALETLLKAMDDIRDLSRQMVTGQEQQGLIAAVRKLAEEINHTHVFHVTVVHDDSKFEQLSCAKQKAIFRIIQEQMNNTIKYSKATQVVIKLQCADNMVCLCIEDNGVGFDMQKVKKGIGLKGICERAGAWHGEAVVRSAVGYGCTMSVKIPFYDAPIKGAHWQNR